MGNNRRAFPAATANTPQHRPAVFEYRYIAMPSRKIPDAVCWQSSPFLSPCRINSSSIGLSWTYLSIISSSCSAACSSISCLACSALAAIFLGNFNLLETRPKFFQVENNRVHFDQVYNAGESVRCPYRKLQNKRDWRQAFRGCCRRSFRNLRRSCPSC